MQVEYRNVACRIVRVDDYERDWLRALLTFRTVGATGVERPMCLFDEGAGDSELALARASGGSRAQVRKALDNLEMTGRVRRHRAKSGTRIELVRFK